MSALLTSNQESQVYQLVQLAEPYEFLVRKDISTSEGRYPTSESCNVAESFGCNLCELNCF